MTDGPQAVPAIDVEISIDGDFSDVADDARTKLGKLARLTRVPVSHARLRLSRHRDPAVDRPVVAQGRLDVGGQVIYAETEASTAGAAIDELESRLRVRLMRVLDARGWRHHGEDTPPWRREAGRSGAASEAPPGSVRRKSFAMVPCTVDVAVGEMELLSYDFHLFHEIGSGTAALVYRGGPTGYRLALVAPELAAQLAEYRVLVTISPHPLSCLTECEARDRMVQLDVPFLFFIEASQGRACVLYRRHDGDYGLITPPAPERPVVYNTTTPMTKRSDS
jgi:ribosome-associated translation inhibitor RaiA